MTEGDDLAGHPEPHAGNIRRESIVQAVAQVSAQVCTNGGVTTQKLGESDQHRTTDDGDGKRVTDRHGSPKQNMAGETRTVILREIDVNLRSAACVDAVA